MTRPLIAVDAADPLAVRDALRAALAGDGAAVLPVPSGSALPVPSGSLEQGSLEQGAVEHGLLEQSLVEQSLAGQGRVPDDVALVIETSGSTGTPKRVALTAAALTAGAAASAQALGGAGQWLLALPAHYVAGAQVLVRSILAGTEPVLLPDGHFDAHDFAHTADTMTGDHRFTSLVPVQLERVVEAAAADPRVRETVNRFTGILVGGQAVRPELAERARELGMALRLTYGSSETAGGCVYDGMPIGETDVRIVEGTVQLSGPTLALGYLGDPARTAATFLTENGKRWYRTGDLGEIVDGRLRVLGRTDNVIISGGEKVSLDAIERVVRQLPGFDDAVVIAEENPQWGHRPVVVLWRDTGTSLEAVRRVVSQQLGKAAAPDRLVRLAPLKPLASGKPDRQAIARAAAASLEQSAQ